MQTLRNTSSPRYICTPAQSFLGSSPAGLVTIFYCLRFDIPQTWRARSPYLYPPGTGWPSYTPKALGCNPKSKSKSKSKLLYHWRFTADQFVLASSHLRLMTRIPPPQTEPLRYYSWRKILSDEKMGLSVINMLGLSSSVHFAHIACYWKFFSFALRTSPVSVRALQDRSCLSYISYAATAAYSLERSYSHSKQKNRREAFGNSNCREHLEINNRKLQEITEIRNSYSSPDMIRLIIWSRHRRVMYLGWIRWEMQKKLVGNPEGKTNPRHRWENNWNFVVPRMLWWPQLYPTCNILQLSLTLHIFKIHFNITPKVSSNIIFSVPYQFYFNTCKTEMDKSLQMPL
jgi:hypothetical protein